MVPTQGSIVFWGKLENNSWYKSSQSVVAKNGIKENIQWAEDGLKPVSKGGAVA